MVAGMIGLMLAVLFLIGTVFGVIIVRDRGAAQYPGAVPLSFHDHVSVYPQVSYKRAAAYRSMDDFVSIYNWYSRGFSLGPEKQAQSNCIHMYDTKTQLGMSWIMTVTLCDTPNGRMIFVQRTLEVEGW